MSELYELPAGWDTKFFNETVENFDKSRVPIKANERKSIHGTYPYYGSTGIIDYVDDYIFDGEFLLISEDGANLVMRTYPIAFIVSGKFWVNNHAHIIKAKAEVTSNKYLELYFSSIDLKPYITGSAQPKLSQKKLNEIKIPLPPLQEQKRIVDKLDSLFAKIDQAIALHQQNINEAEGFMGSVLNEVFGDLEGKYEKKELKDIIKIIGGGTPSKSVSSYWTNGNIKWATVGDMNVETIDNTELSITESGLKNSSSNIISKEGIVIATRVGLGKVCYLSSDTAFNQDLKGLLPLNEDLEVRYLYNYFKHIGTYIISNGAGATVKGVKLDFIKSLKMPFPPLQRH